MPPPSRGVNSGDGKSPRRQGTCGACAITVAPYHRAEERDGRHGPAVEVEERWLTVGYAGARPGVADAGSGHGRFRRELLGVGAAQPARPSVQGQPRPVVVPAVAAGGGAGRGRLPGPYPGGRADRPVRRPGDVPDRVGGHHRAGALPRPGRALLPRRAAGGRLLPRHRRQRLRRRCTARQRLVPAHAARSRHRCLRRRHGWHRDQRPDHREAGRHAQHVHSLPDHRRGAGRVRRRRRAAAA